MEEAAQALWKDREKIARLPLKAYGEFFVLTDVGLARYPSLWDFAVLRLSEWLGERRGRAEPTAFAAEDYSRTFIIAKPAIERLGSIYEESAHLGGGNIDRTMAAERWRVARV